MPSGDAIQSAIFVVFLYHLDQSPYWLILFHVGVCLGRVYYMCHWLADTIIASLLGSFIGYILLLAYSSGSFNFMPFDLL